MRGYSLLACLALVVAVSLCVAPPNGIPPTPADNESNLTRPATNTTAIVETPTIYISEEMDIPRDACSAKGIEGKVLVIHKTGCPACAVAVPRLEELEPGFPEIEFEFLDMVESEAVDRIKEIGVIPYYVPTAIIDCHALVGMYSKEDYKALIEAITVQPS